LINQELKMRHIILCTMALFAALFSKIAAQSKVEFEYPDDIADTAKKAFVKQFKQGRVLYDIACAKCHSTTVNKKELIPDFSLPQLMDYEIRIWPQHQEKLADTQITDLELADIVLFLRYKKRNPK